MGVKRCGKIESAAKNRWKWTSLEYQQPSSLRFLFLISSLARRCVVTPRRGSDMTSHRLTGVRLSRSSRSIWRLNGKERGVLILDYLEVGDFRRFGPKGERRRRDRELGAFVDGQYSFFGLNQSTQRLTTFSTFFKGLWTQIHSWRMTKTDEMGDRARKVIQNGERALPCRFYVHFQDFSHFSLISVHLKG